MTSPVAPMADSLGHLILVAERLHSVLAASAGLSAPETRALEHLQLQGPMSQRRLAQLIGLSTGAVTGLVDRLERRGVCTREAHPRDRRTSVVTLTDEGRAVLRALGEALTLVGSVVPDDRQSRLAADLRTIAGAMSERTANLLNSA